MVNFAHSPELIDRVTERNGLGAGARRGHLIERRRPGPASDAATKAITSGSDGRGQFCSLAELNKLIGTKWGARGWLGILPFPFSLGIS